MLTEFCDLIVYDNVVLYVHIKEVVILDCPSSIWKEDYKLATIFVVFKN